MNEYDDPAIVDFNFGPNGERSKLRENGRNRYRDVHCQKRRRVTLTWPPGNNSDYIHANYVGTPVSDRRFVCTQGPTRNTVFDFWRLVIQEGTDTIVMLCNCIEKGIEKCAPYWPYKEKETANFDGIEVINELVSPIAPDETAIRVTILTLKWMEGEEKKEREIRHYQWVDWPDRGIPSIKLSAVSLLARARETTKPIVAHCSAGIGRTGTVVAIEYLFERFQSGIPYESMIDIVRGIRDQRAYCIQMDLQYVFIHRLMLFYFFEKLKLAQTEENKTLYTKFSREYNCYAGSF
ncbi:Tyrosine-protein phosphatase Lar-like [Aphelenchoides bicaudatus]|nr:Tyrosine-protein phosphatase Lar-like [Aphelenchoides bicaudatus]